MAAVTLTPVVLHHYPFTGGARTSVRVRHYHGAVAVLEHSIEIEGTYPNAQALLPAVDQAETAFGDTAAREALAQQLGADAVTFAPAVSIEDDTGADLTRDIAHLLGE